MTLCHGRKFFPGFAKNYAATRINQGFFGFANHFCCFSYLCVVSLGSRLIAWNLNCFLACISALSVEHIFWKVDQNGTWASAGCNMERLTKAMLQVIHITN